MMSDEFELLVDRQALCGEGPLWVPSLNCLYWVDILRRELHIYDRDSGLDETRVLPLTVTALAATNTGQLIAAADRGFARLYPGRAALDPVTVVASGDRMNDGACDPQGRFIAGTLTYDRHPARCALYLLEGGEARALVDGLTVSNGLGWSPDGTTMYLVDTTPGVIWAFEYDVVRGEVGAGRRWVICPEMEGRPDGLVVDAEGCVWVAMHWSGRIHRYSPAGDLETVLWAPTKRVTSLAFGGRRLNELYVTSGCFGYDERGLVDDPYAGGLFRFRPGVSGVSPVPWNGL